MSATASWTIAARSLTYFRRTHAAVALGIAAATAVIVGALVVGDSVRGSLRGLVVRRLANIECLLHSQTYFDRDILRPLAIDTPGIDLSIEPGIILPSCTVERRIEDQVRRASQVQVIAVADAFWEKVVGGPEKPLAQPLGDDEIALNESLARELNASIGDQLTLRLNSVAGVPADNPLGQRDDRTINLPRQRIVAILQDEGIGGVSFLAGQSVPRNVFCSLATVQDILECGSRVNAAFVLNQTPSTSVNEGGQSWCDRLNSQLRPNLEDYGLQLEHHRRVFPSPGIDAVAGAPPETDVKSDSAKTVFDYFQLSSQALMIDRETLDALARRLAPQPTRLIAYLANSTAKIELLGFPVAPGAMRRDRELTATEDSPQAVNSTDKQDSPRDPSAGMQGRGRFGPNELINRDHAATKPLSREVPYSIIVGVDSNSQLDLERYRSIASESVRVPYCWINSWLADQISAGPGDWIQVKFFEPETVDGRELERYLNLMIVGIVPLTEPVEPFRPDSPAKYATEPTVFNDPNMTPEVPGLTDKESIANWDAPFKLNEDIILPVDDDYYSNYRLTPKIFTPYGYAASSALFGSRFGHATSLRFPAEDLNQEQLRAEIEDALLSTRDHKGLVFLALRKNMLKAASGTTPFDQLFLALSFFVIVAAILLVTLLFKLGIQQRANQLGLLTAQGYAPARIRGLLLRELAVVSLCGAGIGVLLGLVYARAMIAGLETWWIGAISSPFLQFSFTWTSLVVGAIAGVATSLATMYWELRRMVRVTPLALLRGQTEVSKAGAATTNHVTLAIAGFVALGALGLVVAGLGQTGMARAGSFFGSGMLLLGAGLVWIHYFIARGGRLGHENVRHSSLFTLAWRAISRNPMRSSLALGLLSVASFLIASMGVFHVSPSPRGYGGFDLIGETSQPIYRNIGSPSTRSEMIGQAAKILRSALIVPVRARKGEDASCNNLFQVAQPTVLGISRRLSDLHEYSPTAVQFDWAASANPSNPWRSLARPATGDAQSPIPVILDQNTAAWSLKQGASLNSPIVLQYGKQRVHFQTVGLLSNSVLQGKLLIGEQNFRHLFPEVNGYSLFLIQSGVEVDSEAIVETLESGWGDVGMDVTSSRETLARLLGVQNTYISAFQSLGALGLLLGTFGLVAAQLRSVLERRSELALMRAVGFSTERIARMLTLETAILLGGGLLVGVAAAAIALVPYVIETGPELSTINPLLMLTAVLLAGFVAALIAVRAATRQSVLAGLRSE